MEKTKMPKKHKALKVIGIVLGVLLALVKGLYFYLMTHTQIIVGMIQKAAYGEAPINSYKPFYDPIIGITPIFKSEQINAVVIDDAPLDYNALPLACRILVGNYVKGSIYLSKPEIKRYNNIQSLTANYPAAVLLRSEYRHDMEVMHEELDKLDSEYLHIDPYKEQGLTKPHCFVSAERTDPVAKDAFDRMIAFLNEKTK